MIVTENDLHPAGGTMTADEAADVDALARYVAATYAAFSRIEIGFPVLQDNGELEYPGYIDDTLIGFYASPGAADTALLNTILKPQIDAVCDMALS